VRRDVCFCQKRNGLARHSLRHCEKIHWFRQTLQVLASAICKSQICTDDEVLQGSRNQTFASSRVANNARRDVNTNPAYI